MSSPKITQVALEAAIDHLMKHDGVIACRIVADDLVATQERQTFGDILDGSVDLCRKAQSEIRMIFERLGVTVTCVPNGPLLFVVIAATGHPLNKNLRRMITNQTQFVLVGPTDHTMSPR